MERSSTNTSVYRFALVEQTKLNKYEDAISKFGSLACVKIGPELYSLPEHINFSYIVYKNQQVKVTVYSTDFRYL